MVSHRSNETMLNETTKDLLSRLMRVDCAHFFLTALSKLCFEISHGGICTMETGKGYRFGISFSSKSQLLNIY